MPITNRDIHVKGSTPSLGAAGSTLTDAVFGSRMARVTDSAFTTDLGSTGRSFRSPASSYQQGWNATSTRFQVLRGDGTVWIVTVNPTTLATARLGNAAPSFASGTCTFDSANANYLYGISTAVNHHTIARTDIGAVPITTSDFLDLDSITGGLTDTYIGALTEGNGYLNCTYGGASQEAHKYCLWYPLASPGSRKVINTMTLNGMDEFNTHFTIHSAQIDKSGRYVSLVSTTSVVDGNPVAPYRIYIWDTTLDTVVPVTPNSSAGGHEVLGWTTRINNATLGAFDSHQWVYTPSLSAPTSNRVDVISPLLTPQEIYAAEHASWNNVTAAGTQPFLSSLYRYYNGPNNIDPINSVAWRAWDDEIVAVFPTTGAVTRYCHHRSLVYPDTGTVAVDFWYTPRVCVSPNGTLAIFTSNWDKTLGADAAEGNTRQDVFLVELATHARAYRKTRRFH